MTDTTQKTDWRTRDLDDLIDPVTVETFLRDYWGQQPLLVRGSPGKFTGLFDLDRLERLISMRADRQDGSFRLAALRPARPEEPLTTGWTEVIDPGAVTGELARGTTLCITDVSVRDPALDEMVRRIRRRIGLLGNLRFNCFLSPPGSGADLHIDARVTMSIQLHGRKGWMYGAKPAVEWPLSNAQLLPDGTPVWMFPWRGSASWEQLEPVSPDQLSQVVLEPGDVLCLPAGTWHTAKAIDTSLALNLSFSPPDMLDFVRIVLEDLLLERTEWRSGCPVTAQPPRDGGPPPKEVTTFLATRLREASAMLDAAGSAESLVVATWNRLFPS